VNSNTDLAKCVVSPVLWFKTVPMGSDLNGSYKWADQFGNYSVLRNYDSRGPEFGSEYFVDRNQVRTFNFNPSLNLSFNGICKEVLLKNTNLSQTTIIGAWFPLGNKIMTDEHLLSINGRKNQSLLFTKSRMYFGGCTAIDSSFLFASGNQFLVNVNNDSYHSEAGKIVTFYKAEQSEYSPWGEPKKAVINTGGKLLSTNVNINAPYSNAWGGYDGFSGFVPELLVFDRVLSPMEQNVYESYMAIKYGVSLKKSYYSSNGGVIWDYDLNATFNNRIFGYGREDAIGLKQLMSTTSYQENGYYSELPENDSYMNNDSYQLPTDRRLLVVGRQNGNNMRDGEYAVIGDNNGSLGITSVNMGVFTGMMGRRWLVANNALPSDTVKEKLQWFSNKISFTDINTFKSTITKAAIDANGFATTQNPLKGSDGYFAWTTGSQLGTVVACFTYSSLAGSIDYGYRIYADGSVFALRRGGLMDCKIKCSPGQRIEIEKHGNQLSFRLNGELKKDAFVLITNPYDQKASVVLI